MVTAKRNSAHVSQRRKKSGTLLASHLMDLALSKKKVRERDGTALCAGGAVPPTELTRGVLYFGQRSESDTKAINHTEDPLAGLESASVRRRMDVGRLFPS